MNKQKTPITIQRMLLGTKPVFSYLGLYAASRLRKKYKDSSPSPDLSILNESTMQGLAANNIGHITNANIMVNS